jgi:hypothetical protein
MQRRCGRQPGPVRSRIGEVGRMTLPTLGTSKTSGLGSSKARLRRFKFLDLRTARRGNLPAPACILPPASPGPDTRRRPCEPISLHSQAGRGRRHVGCLSPGQGSRPKPSDATIGRPRYSLRRPRYSLNCVIVLERLLRELAFPGCGCLARGPARSPPWHLSRALLVPPSPPRNGGPTWCIHRRRAYDRRAITAPETGATSWAFS